MSTQKLDRPLRILFVDHVATMSGGEIALLHLIRQLDRAIVEPLVLLGEEGPLAEKLRVCASLHVLPMSESVKAARKDGLGASSLLQIAAAWNIARYVLKLVKFLREEQIDLVHANSLKADILSGFAGRLAGVPVLWHVRDRISEDYLPKAIVKVFRIAARYLPTALIANSHSTAETLNSVPAIRKRLFVVHDGTDLSLFVPHDKPANSDDQINIGLIGRISPWKGQDIFLRAAHQLHSTYPQARFKLIGAALFGETEYESEIHRMVVDLGLSDFVEFKGFCKNIPGEIAQLDILVHASTKAEPFGQVVIEGMAAGKAVVATSGGGVLEIVRDGVTGLLVPMGDYSSMAGAIVRLMADASLRNALGTAARREVIERFSIQRTAEKVQQVYEKLPNLGPPNRGKPPILATSGHPNFVEFAARTDHASLKLKGSTKTD